MTEPHITEQPAVNSMRPESPKKQAGKKKPGNKRKPNKTRQAQLQQQQDRSLDAIFAQFARAQLESQTNATNTTDAAAAGPTDAVSEFLHKRIVAQREQEAAARERAEERTNTLVRAALRDARRAGEAAGTDRVRTLVKFLRAASIKRQLQPVVTPQSAAFEALLQMVYMGDESAVAAVERLHLGVEALVADDSVPYRIVRDVSFMSEEDLLDGKDLVEPEETASTAPVVAEVSPDATLAEEEPVAKDDATAKLSFIQQSEIDSEAPSTTNTTETTTVESTATEPVTEPATAQSAGEPTSPASPKDEESEETKDPAKKKKKRPYYRHRSKKSTVKTDA